MLQLRHRVNDVLRDRSGWVLTLVLAMSAPALAQTTWHVDDDHCPGPGNGSIEDPFCSIQDAIDASADGDTVIVETGTYLEAIDFIGRAITLRSTDPANRTVVVTTVIDGTGHDHAVQCVNGEGSGTVLSGFVITGGGVAGMRNLASNPTVTGCSFANNGDGMYNDASSPTVTGCSFTHNDSPGAIGMFNSNSGATMTNCSFIANNDGIFSASNGGGGPLVVTNCSFTSNRSFGMYQINGESTTVTNCSFSSNAIGLSISKGLYATSATVTNCSFTSSRVHGMEISGGPALTVADCTLSDNVFAGMFNTDSSPTVTRCTFSNNGPTWGGMVNQGFSSGSSPTIRDCVFSENAHDGGGGGIRNDGDLSIPTVTNTVFCLNTPDDIYGDYVDGGGNKLAAPFCPPPVPRTAPVLGDLEGDGDVDLVDYRLFQASFTGPS